MADINISGTKKRISTKVDLTAMVDLGFFLITFFMMATTMYKPKVMEINHPVDSPDPQNLPLLKTITLMLGNNNKVYYYFSTSETKNINDMVLDSTDYSFKGIRKVLKDRIAFVIEKHGIEAKEDLFVLIKPLPTSSLKNTVYILDEMSILKIKSFALLKTHDPVDSLVAKTVNQNL